MMSYNRVYPSKPNVRDKVDDDSTMDEVEAILRRIDDEIDSVMGSDYTTNSALSTSMIKTDFSKDGQREDRHKNNRRSSMSKLGEGEEVKFSHENDDPIGKADMAVTELKRQFDIMKHQLDDYKSKCQTSMTKLTQAEEQVLELKEKNEDLADELEYSKTYGYNPNNKGAIGDSFGGMGGKGGSGNSRHDQMKLAFVSDDDAFDIVFDDINDKESMLNRLYAYLLLYLPFQKEIRVIDSHFGSSVSSYFEFYQFLFIQFIFVNIIVLVFTIVHVFFMIGEGYNTTAIIGKFGTLPGFMQYSSYSVRERSNYTILVVVCTISLLVSILVKLVREDIRGKEKDAADYMNFAEYGKELFVSWDNSLVLPDEVDNSKGHTGLYFVAMLEDTRIKGKVQSRTREKTFYLLIRRIFGFILFLSILTVTFFIIIYLTVYATDITNTLKNTIFEGVSAFIIPIVSQLISKFYPDLVKFVVSLEDWDTTDTETNILLFRLYVSDMLNNLLVVFSYMFLADPMLLASQSFVRKSLELAYSSSYDCRMDQAAISLFNLTLSNVILSMVTPLFIQSGKLVAFTLIGAQRKRKEFEIADNIVSVLSLMGLFLVSFPFAPAALLFAPIFIFVKVKFEMLLYLTFYRKPRKPWKAQKAGKFFSYYYLATVLILSTGSSLYFLSSKTFAKSCDIQDDHVGLCASGLSSDNTCTLDTSSPFYETYGNSSSYPSNICSNACGAFIDSSSNFAPLKELLYENTASKFTYIGLCEAPYFSWISLVMAIMMLTITRNTLYMVNSSKQQLVKTLELRLLDTKKQLKKAERKVERFKTVQEDEDDV